MIHVEIRIKIKRLLRNYILFLTLVSCGHSISLAAESVSYIYDAQGRLVEANHSGSGSNTGLVVKYQYDLAGNRTVYIVTGSKNRGQKLVVVPLNGFTIIPINP